MAQEIDKYELAIFLLRVSGLESLIKEEKLEKRLRYRMHYPHMPYAKRFNRETRRLYRQKCLNFA